MSVWSDPGPPASAAAGSAGPGLSIMVTASTLEPAGPVGGRASARHHSAITAAPCTAHDPIQAGAARTLIGATMLGSGRAVKAFGYTCANAHM